MQSPSPSPSDAIQAQGVPGGWSHHTLGHPATSSETKGSSWVAAGHSSEQVTGPQATAAGRERHACKLTPCRTTPGVSLRADGAGATSRRGPGLVSSPRVPFLALSLGSPGAGVAALPPHTAWSWPCSARCPLAGRLEMGSGRVGTEPTAPQPALPPPPPRGSASDFRFLCRALGPGSSAHGLTRRLCLSTSGLPGAGGGKSLGRGFGLCTTFCFRFEPSLSSPLGF